jgi:hypothetical protein
MSCFAGLIVVQPSNRPQPVPRWLTPSLTNPFLSFKHESVAFTHRKTEGPHMAKGGAAWDGKENVDPLRSADSRSRQLPGPHPLDMW